MTIKLGTVLTHIGQPPPEADPLAALSILGIDTELARKAAYKIYFEVADDDQRFEVAHDVFFIVNNTKYGTLFAIKYGVKKNE